MSNTQLREGAPKSRAEMQRYLRRHALIQRTVEKLYLANGGRALEQLMALCRATLAGALVCREDDARRLRENPRVTWREKGERPLISVSEQRLHSNQMSRYLAEKQFIRGQALTQINEAINAFAPESEEDLKALLDGLVDAAEPGAATRDDALLVELLPRLSETDRKDFIAALELNDPDSVKAVLARQPEEVRSKYAPLAA
ncbi:hypothetical protein PLCT1_01278 [Planctomycetaceae bacterium]|nr:hypothetical protein PLCT1_01278 [Planctomycetaceae bacterium]